MTKSDKILIIIIEFIVNPKKYLETRFFLKNTNELKFEKSRFENFSKNLEERLQYYKETGNYPNSVCSNGHKYEKPYLNDFDEEKYDRENMSIYFCPECIYKKDKEHILMLEKKSKIEKISYPIFKVIFALAVLYLFYKMIF